MINPKRLVADLAGRVCYNTALVASLSGGEHIAQIEGLRAEHNAKETPPRWPVCVPLLWPFVPCSSEVVERLERTASRLRPVKVTLASPAYPHSRQIKGKSLLYLPVKGVESSLFRKRVEEGAGTDPLLRMRARLVGVFPEVSVRGDGGDDSYKAQVNLGMVERHSIQYVARDIPWEPKEVTVEVCVVLSVKGGGVIEGEVLSSR